MFTYLYTSTYTQTVNPILQSIEAKPNFVQEGKGVTVTVRLDHPTSHDIAVDLSSSDPALLTVNPTAIVHQGDDQGTAYVQARAVPSYQAPIEIRANYGGLIRRTEVTVGSVSLKRSTPERSPPSSSVMLAGPAIKAESKPLPRVSQAGQGPEAKPATLDPELTSRLEEAQGTFSCGKRVLGEREDTYVSGNFPEAGDYVTNLRSRVRLAALQ